jgi:hypothetical protein
VLDLVEVLGLLHNGEDQPTIRNRKGVTAGVGDQQRGLDNCQDGEAVFRYLSVLNECIGDNALIEIHLCQNFRIADHTDTIQHKSVSRY